MNSVGFTKPALKFCALLSYPSPHIFANSAAKFQCWLCKTITVIYHYSGNNFAEVPEEALNIPSLETINIGGIIDLKIISI